MSLSDQQVEQLKGLVRLKIHELEALLDNRSSVADQHQEQRDDEAANLDINISSAVETKVQEGAKQELTRLRRKLAWLDSEEAGYCDQCGCEIPFARLKASLGTRLCVTCAEKHGE